MGIKHPKINSPRVFVTRADLLKVSAYLKNLAAQSPTIGIEHSDGPPESGLVDISIYLGGKTWMYLPPDFEFSFPEAVFVNESEQYDVLMKFSSNLISEALEIPARGTAVLTVGKGIDATNTADLYSRDAGTKTGWEKRSSSTGNGASMGINNP